LNTATDSAVARNWVGLFGAYLSDILMQSLGLTAFLLPFWLGGVGWTWMRSRPGGSPILRWMGAILALIFLPAVFGLLPWHWRWLHIVPVEGVVGRLVAGLLVVYLNIQGAWLVATALAACGLYFASAISFWVIRESLAERWAQLSAWREKWRDRRETRGNARGTRSSACGTEPARSISEARHCETNRRGIGAACPPAESLPLVFHAPPRNRSTTRWTKSPLISARISGGSLKNQLKLRFPLHNAGRASGSAASRKRQRPLPQQFRRRCCADSGPCKLNRRRKAGESLARRETGAGS
jgi:DNA segregation ATPase FtsK/SpoIIIE-like protein